MSNKAFVEIVFPKNVKEIFSKLVAEIVPKNMLYSSDEVSHIKGDMTKTLHCTILFGLDRFQINNPELIDLVEKNKILEVELGNLFFFEGYQNMYKILCIEVLDANKTLDKFAKKLEQFSTKTPREFRPHLTLAYVSNDYKIPKQIPSIPEKVNALDTRITLVSDFLKEVNSAN